MKACLYEVTWVYARKKASCPLAYIVVSRQSDDEIRFEQDHVAMYTVAVHFVASKSGCANAKENRRLRTAVHEIDIIIIIWPEWQFFTCLATS